MEKRSKYYDNILVYVYCLRVGVDESLVPFFQNYQDSVLLPIRCKIFPLKDIITVFSQTIAETKFV